MCSRISEYEGPHIASAIRPPGCVEVAMTGDGRVLVRDTKNQQGPVLTFTAHEWGAFVAGVKAASSSRYGS